MTFSEFIKRAYRNAMFYVSVPKCVMCRTPIDKDDRGICKSCLVIYSNLKERNCSVCAKPLYRCTCTNDYLNSHYVKKLIKVYRYIHDDPLPTNSLIYSLKRDNRNDVLDFLSDELCDAISASVSTPETYVFTSVPRRRAAKQKYGIDHAELLARSCAKKLGAIYMPLLSSNVKRAQKKLMQSERIKNASFKILKSAPPLDGKKVVLIDDIVTTGASMGSCAMLIRGLGTKEIIGAAISIAYKDSYIPLNTEDRFKIVKK